MEKWPLKWRERIGTYRLKLPTQRNLRCFELHRQVKQTGTSISYLSFFYSILRWSVAVSTMRRQSSRIAAFLQADAGQCSVGQGLPPLHEARCGWVFLTVASNLDAAPGSPQRQHGGGTLVVSCGQYIRRAANICQ